jgi:hypothetical protein
MLYEPSTMAMFVAIAGCSLLVGVTCSLTDALAVLIPNTLILILIYSE